MKLRVGLFWMAVVAAICFGISLAPQGAFTALLGAGFAIWLAGNLLASPGPRACVTLTTTEILQDTLEAFKAQLPMLTAFATDFSNARSRKGESIIAHVRSLPSVQSYDATNGYKPNAAEADSLLTDVTVALDQLKHVPVKVDYLTQLASRKNLYLEAVADYAHVLAKDVVDFVLGKVTDTNVTHETVEPAANFSVDTLEKIRTGLNTQKAAQAPRWGLVNSTVAQYLATDSRIASRDYYGQLNGGTGYRTFTNVAGFQNIWEYPDLPANSIDLNGIFGHRNGVIICSRLPDVQSAAESVGVPSIANFETLTDPESGLSMLGIGWQEAGTFDVYLTVALLYGAAVGTIGGAADAVVDKALHKTVGS